MLSDTTRADLESLLAEQDNGWCAYNRYAPNGIGASFGIGGCLIEQMLRLLERQQLSTGALHLRKYNMIAALGFAYDAQAMFRWNDQQRDPDVIKHRIKDALNGELNVK